MSHPLREQLRLLRRGFPPCSCDAGCDSFGGIVTYCELDWAGGYCMRLSRRTRGRYPTDC